MGVEGRALPRAALCNSRHADLLSGKAGLVATKSFKHP